jgi:hypothetical protein
MRTALTCFMHSHERAHLAQELDRFCGFEQIPNLGGRTHE